MSNIKRKKLTKVLMTIIIILFTTIVNQYGSHLYINYRDNVAYNELLIQQKIDYIDKQLTEFYIPLNIQLHRSKRLFVDFQTKHKDKNSILDTNPNSSQLERAEWRLYLLSVFKSTHTRMEDLVITKRYLSIQHSELENKLNILVQHINEYKVIFQRWGDGNTSENISPIHFPDTIDDLIERDIEKLKFEKKQLQWK